jgi:hypothetical protein
MNGRRKMGFLPKLALPQKGRQILMDRVKGFSCSSASARAGAIMQRPSESEWLSLLQDS